MSFENKILRIICEPEHDNELECWCIRRNKEIRETTGVKTKDDQHCERIKWFEYVMRRLNSEYL